MPQQILLTNTFNEFRLAYNEVATDVDSLNELLDGSGPLSANTVRITSLSNTGSRVLFTGAPGSGDGAFINDDEGLTYNPDTNTLSVSGPLQATSLSTIGGAINVGTANTVAINASGNVNVGSGKAIIVAANGSFISPTGNIELNTTDSRIDAYHIHAEWHLGAGGDVEEWAAGKGTDVESHKVFGIGDEDAAVDMLVANKNDGADAYAEFIAVNDTGTIDDGWCSFGINSSNYAESAYGVTKADDGYLLFQAPAGTEESGDLVIGTGGNGTGNKILFSANGFDDPANNTQMIIHPGQKVEIAIDTESSNTGTGALVVRGGLGLQGNLNVGGSVVIVGDITLQGSGNTVTTDSLAVESPIIFVGQNNIADTFDLGFTGIYNDGVSEKYTGFVRDASDNGIFKLFANTDILPANTVDFTDVNLQYGSVMVGEVMIVNPVASSSKTTGALVVTGGLGVGGAVHATSFTANTGATINNILTNGELSGASNTSLATTWAIKNYVDVFGGADNWSSANTTITASPKDAIFADTTTAPFTINLPANAVLGDSIRIVDVAGRFATNNLTVGRANTSHRIMGTASNLLLNVNNASVNLVYSGDVNGWRLV